MSDIKNVGPIWFRYEVLLPVDTGIFDETWGAEKISVTQGPLLRGTIRIETEEKVYSLSEIASLEQHIVDTELALVQNVLAERYGKDNVKVWVDHGFVGDIQCIKQIDLERKGLVERKRIPLSPEQKARLDRLRNPPQPSREELTIELDERLLPVIDGLRKEIPVGFKGVVHFSPERSRGKVIEVLCKNALKMNEWLKTLPWEFQQQVSGEVFRKPFFKAE